MAEKGSRNLCAYFDVTLVTVFQLKLQATFGIFVLCNVLSCQDIQCPSLYLETICGSSHRWNKINLRFFLLRLSYRHYIECIHNLFTIFYLCYIKTNKKQLIFVSSFGRQYLNCEKLYWNYSSKIKIKMFGLYMSIK